MSDTQQQMIPDELQQPFRGLLLVGKHSDALDYKGHKIVMSTLTQGQEIAVGQLIKQYIGQHNFNVAMKVYTLAAAVETIDGSFLYEDIGTDTEVSVIEKKAEIIKQLYSETIDVMYKKYVGMVTEAREVNEELKK